MTDRSATLPDRLEPPTLWARARRDTGVAGSGPATGAGIGDLSRFADFANRGINFANMAMKGL